MKRPIKPNKRRNYTPRKRTNFSVNSTAHGIRQFTRLYQKPPKGVALSVWWCGGVIGPKVVVIAVTALRAAQLSDIPSWRFQRATSPEDQRRALDVGESVWKLTGGKWKRLK